jgi:addiction module HigA family antidote
MTPGVDPTAYAPQTVSSPGETLKETLEHLGIGQADLARRTGLSTKHINQVVQGTAPLSPETALLLERATGMPAGLWNALEAKWRTQVVHEQEERDLAGQTGWLDNFPLDALVDQRVLPDRDRTIANLRRLLDFFAVATPRVAEGLWDGYRTAFRRSTVASRDEYATVTWLRLAERHAHDTACAPYDRADLTALLPRLRGLTLSEPQTWFTDLPRLCAQVGVAVVFVPALPRTSISGATRWLTPDKVMIALSDRFKRDDQFWFSVFHEIGHVLLHGKRLTFLDDSEKLADGDEDASETEANDFAALSLIPAQHAAAYRQLQSKPTIFTRIEAFAAAVGVSPSIVVGRLQHDGSLPWNQGNRYKRPIAFP